MTLKQVMQVMFAISLSTVVKADALLDMLEAEALKVEPGTSQAGDMVVNSDRIAHQSFEEMLNSRYHGSYIFYQKLPDRMKLEIFQDYVEGIEVDELRSKIINRYLQQN